ncbi:hypothetical protein PVAND_008392 [Polypedilum vanderplanki]|uniref:Factor VIII intron 22 protein n=1 Tax=Polypedilum vanderplanki TaxID=319348 RepID=A0A9J6CAG3_POLVA|nr:hypothetical protein PVAND_008392 [Polypedilum vanderplanki]
MSELIEEFRTTANKLKRIQRVVFKKQDTKELITEFQQLAYKFDNSYLSEYAGLCFLGVAKCNEGSGGDVEALLKGARHFRKANDRKIKLGFMNNNEHLEGAYRCYSQALSIEKDPVMKACIIREFGEININLNVTSDFHSPSHRIHELELASIEDIKQNNFISALDKLTEISDDFTERKCEFMYTEVIGRIEVTRLLLLLILELPASRQSPSHIKLLEKYSFNNENFDSETVSQNPKYLDENLTLMLEILVNACQNKENDSIKEACDNISCHHSISKEQYKLLKNLVIKYNM